MTEREEGERVWIGVDVGKAVVDVACSPRGAVVRVSRSAEALEAWARTLPEGSHVVLEATGGYEQVVAAAVRAQGHAACVVNPRQVRDFAKATGQLAKTDRLDARVLAQFGEAVRPRVTAARAVEDATLRALVDRRRQLVETRTAEKNRRHTAPEAVVASIDEHIAWLDRQIDQLQAEIETQLKRCGPVEARVAQLQGAPGVGPIVAVTLATHFPELGTVGRKQITALAGLAPYARDSGLQRRRRAIWGGRADARAMLFLAAQAAARWSGPQRAFYERLVANGKPKKAALAAVARKLLVALNAMLRDDRPWQPTIAAQPGCC